MTKAKHTPGPWSVENIGVNCLLISGQVEQVGTSGAARDYYNRIASVTQRDPHPVHGAGIGSATAAANARLIAAAPELLDALIECLECEFAVSEKAAIAQARAAIAKATGDAICTSLDQ